MKQRLVYILISVIIGFSSTVLANNIETQYSGWLNFALKGPIRKQSNWLYLLDLQARFFSGFPHFRQGVVRPALGYSIDPRVSVWLGYGWFPTVPKGITTVFNENRIWQGINITPIQNNHFKLFLRTRLEERKQQYFRQWGIRFREQIKMTWLNYLPHHLSPVVYEEAFFNVTKPAWVSQDTFSQNRLFLGLSKPIKKNVNFEFGYLNLILFRGPDGNERMVHILLLALTINT